MAGVKVGGAKTKLKDDKSKFMNSNGCGDEPDSALLRKPIQTSITGFAQASKIFDTATEELKGLLTTECDLLYECKVCRNLFRSLLNFISHKRIYCKEMFNSSVHGHFIKPTSMASEISKINDLEAAYRVFLKNEKNNEPVVPLERIPLSKDLTEVVENLMKNNEVTTSTEEKVLEVEVQQIPTSTAAVFQNLVPNDDLGDDMCSEITEINGMTAKNNAMLKEDGKFELCAEVVCKEDSEQVIQISDDDDINQLSCKICDIQFSTRKTLKFHMKYKHVPDRLVYPCTDCREIFATTWSVLRHLYRVHRKTLTQIRRMREAVQSRAFKMNNMPTAYMKKNKKKVIVEEKLTEEERMDQENQAWMDNMETDSELPRCGGCGRSFERRAALAAHTYTCQSRTRALARKPALSDKKLEKQDEKVQLKKDRPPTPKAQASPNETAEKLTIKQMKSSIMEKEKTSEDDHVMDIDVDEEGSEDESKTNEESDSESDVKNVMLYFPQDVEKANMDALRKLMSEYVDSGGTCKVCKKKYTSPSHLCRHMASHLNWRRYGCKLCSYVNYDKNRLVLHAQTIHKLKGSDEFYMSILRVLPPNEALALSSVPAVLRGEWSINESEEAMESSDSSEPAASSDESEYSSSRTEPIQCNRRKQTFKPAKVVKTKSSSPVKDEQTEKAGTKRPSTVPLEKVMRVLSDNESDKPKPKIKIYKTDEPDTTSRRPVRKRMRPKKDEDFEYDLSNVLKWENNAYRESHAESKVTATSRAITTKRRSNAETSPSESSPEKTEKDKSDKEKEKEKVKEEKTQKQVRNEEKKKIHIGSLAAMSDAAVSLSQAHLRPSSSSFTSRPQFAAQKLPFDFQSHFRNIPPSKLVLSSQDVIPQRKINVTYSKPKDPKPEKGKSDTKEDIDIEKQIDEANARNKFVTALKNTSTSIMQLAKKNAETKQPNPEIAKDKEINKPNLLIDTDTEVNNKPNAVMTKNIEINEPNVIIAADTEINKQITSRQKWIVMKKVKANEDSSESSGKIKFPRIKSLEIAMKSTAGNKMPKAPSTNQNENKISQTVVETDKDHIKKDPLTESVEVLSISNESDESSKINEKT